MQFGFNFSDVNSCTDCCCCCDRFTLEDLLDEQFLSQAGETGGEFRPFVIEWTPPRSVNVGGNPIREREPCDGPGLELPPPPHNEFVRCNSLESPESNPCCKYARFQPRRGSCTTGGVCVDDFLGRDCIGDFVANVKCDETAVTYPPESWEWACRAGEWHYDDACLRFLCRCVRSDGSVVCSKEYGGPTANELDLTELFLDHFGPEPGPGCYIYEAQFFGWRRVYSTYGIPSSWSVPGGRPDPACDEIRSDPQYDVNDSCSAISSKDDAYCLFRGKIGENCGRYPRGACCGTCSCSRTYESDCAGTWYENTTCEDAPCQFPSGSCCQSDGSCTVTVACECSGTWTEGGVCNPNPCSQPETTGSCCVYDADGNFADGFSGEGFTQEWCETLFGLNAEGFFTDPPPAGLGWTIVWTEGGSVGDCPPSP